jgi:hypothetical protein
MRGVCDGLIGAFHGGGGGYAKVHILLHLLHLRILVCAAFFEFILYFLKKISGCQVWLVGWLWCYHCMVGVHCFADIDQADLLGGGSDLLC